jgi:hypothetical protein
METPETESQDKGTPPQGVVRALAGRMTNSVPEFKHQESINNPQAVIRAVERVWRME